MRILVKGAGVGGLAAAFALHRAGHRVTLCEKAPGLGAGASWLAGGMLAPFCERESAEERVLTEGLRAADWWEAAVPGAVTRAGTLVVAPERDMSELDRFARRTRGYEWLDADGIAALEPALSGRFRRALFFREEAHLDPRRVMTTLTERLGAEGVSVRLGAAAMEDGFDRVVDCTGAARRGDLARLRAVRGEMLHLETDEVTLSRPVRLLHPRHPLYVVPRGEGRFMVGATMIESETEGLVSTRSVMELLNAAYALHPAFGEAHLAEAAAGLRPAFPDNLPDIHEEGRMLFLNGFYRHGFLLAPSMAEALVARLAEASSPILSKGAVA
ncbi:glycine oxidase ThiO [Xaviernesmea oryzae]|uniref:Glycine oxidase ThiO n=1 Tax=Xaviernesmea oryzae TaxID=464029 RepID=A0A1Q9AQZ0_9HYPH|nr:glycine oxidase ThiO [Xaviernesmea oryzae]OLP57818.1 glycine oxidase ThiO [Xaviernesmea oryzae]SEL35630.1 glycine oxidase [Xaviernesmea oryzae]